MILLLRSGASADRRKCFRLFLMAALCRAAATQILSREFLRGTADDAPSP